MLDYRANGQRKLVWRSTMAKARKAADEAIDKITEGQAEVLNLKSADAHAYTRARAFLDGGEGETKIDLQIDEAVRIAAEVLRLLAGRATPLEVTRDWLKRNAVELPKITVADAAVMLKNQAETDGKSNDRQKQLAAALDAFTAAFICEVLSLTPKMIADYLTALPFKERTKANHRDTIGFFNRWLVLRGTDFDDLVVGINAVSSALETGGYGDRVLCAVFAFGDDRKRALYWIYNYKRGFFYPFAPARGDEQRDSEHELQLQAQLSKDLPIEPELARWFPLWGIPI